MPRKTKKTIVLFPPKKSLVLKMLKAFGDSKFVWGCFGEKLTNALEIEKIIGKSGVRLELGNRLQETAKNNRQQYIDYIGSLSKRYDSLFWWTSSVCEKSPLASRTFLNTVYLSVARDYLKSSAGCENVVFFVESPGLRRSMQKNLSKLKDFEIIVYDSKLSSLLEKIIEDMRMFLIKIWFLIESLNRILISKYFNAFDKAKIDPSKDITIIHTWVDKRSFTPAGGFRDSYFGDLSKELKRRGKNIVIVPYVLSSISYRDAVNKMRSSSETFLLPYAFVRIRDIFSIIFRIIFKSNKERCPLFGRLDISDLICEELKKDRIGIRLPRDLLLYNVVEGWRRKDLKIASFIQTFENQTWNKAFTLAFRRYYPNTKLIAYQHAATSKMYLNYYFSSEESKILPLADKIITNGRYNAKEFIDSGYDPEKVFSGGAIRFASVLEKAKLAVDRARGHKEFTVLVTMSISPLEAAELFWKVKEAFEDIKEYKVILKFHPVTPFEKAAKLLGMSSNDLPKNFKLSEKPLTEILDYADVLLYTSSTTCFEAMAMGVPTLHVESDYLIDVDPLDFAKNLRRSTGSPEEILDYVQKFKSMSDEKLSKERLKWKNAVKEVFGPVTNETYNLFLT